MSVFHIAETTSFYSIHEEGLTKIVNEDIFQSKTHSEFPGGQQGLSFTTYIPKYVIRTCERNSMKVPNMDA